MLEYIIVLLIFSYFYIKKKIAENNEKKNCISILIASDVHLTFEYVIKLREWTKKNKRKQDILIFDKLFHEQ